MTDERDDIIFRTLRFYKDKEQKVHIKIIAGIDSGKWRNVFILFISKNKAHFIDNVLGSLTYKLNEISEDIKPYRKNRE